MYPLPPETKKDVVWLEEEKQISGFQEEQFLLKLNVDDDLELSTTLA